MGACDMNKKPLASQAITAVIEELKAGGARSGDRIVVNRR